MKAAWSGWDGGIVGMDIIHKIGRAIDPAGPEVYDFNHHLGYYKSRKHRQEALFYRCGFPSIMYNPYYDEWRIDQR